MADTIGSHSVVLNAQVDGLVAGMRKGTGAINEFHRSQGRAAASFQTGSKAASEYGRRVQGFGYQFQDAMIQVSGGQNVANAIAAQGSQFLGMFGPAGAIAGAVLATGGLIYNLLNVEMDTKKAEKDAAKLEKEYQKIQARIEKVRDAWFEIDRIHGEAYLTVNPRTEAETASLRKGLVEESMPMLLKSAKDAEGRMMMAAARKDEKERIRQQDIMLANEQGYAEVRQKVADIDAGITQKRQEQSELFDKQSRAEEEADTKRYQAISRQAEAIREQLRPIEKMKRESKEISDNLFLTDTDKRAAIDALIKPTALPQSLQVNAGASALGGTTGDGGPLLQIQQKMAADMHALLEAARAQLRLFSQA